MNQNRGWQQGGYTALEYGTQHIDRTEESNRWTTFVTNKYKDRCMVSHRLLGQQAPVGELKQDSSNVPSIL